MVNQPIQNHWLGIFCIVGFDLDLILQGQTGIAKPKSAFNSLDIGLRGLQCEAKL